MVGLLASAALILALAGLTKLRTPTGAETALDAARLPLVRARRTLAVRALGVTQLTIAVAALTLPQRAAGTLIAVAYAALTAFAWRLLRVAPDTDCGCFGPRTPGPATATHVAGNAVIAVTGVAAAMNGGPSVVSFAAADPAAGAVMSALAAVLAGLFVQLITALPTLAALQSTSREATR